MQTYANHVQRPKLFLALVVLFFVGFVYTIVTLYRQPTIEHAFRALMTFGLTVQPLILRRSAVVVQDRAIRTEMRMRLGRLMPEGDILAAGLSHRQLAALRFASDAELPGLVRDVVDHNITDGKAIKLKIKDWQADWHRA